MKQRAIFNSFQPSFKRSTVYSASLTSIQLTPCMTNFLLVLCFQLTSYSLKSVTQQKKSCSKSLTHKRRTNKHFLSPDLAILSLLLPQTNAIFFQAVKILFQSSLIIKHFQKARFSNDYGKQKESNPGPAPQLCPDDCTLS